jgi:hypothetical protein
MLGGAHARDHFSIATHSDFRLYENLDEATRDTCIGYMRRLVMKGMPGKPAIKMGHENVPHWNAIISANNVARICRV